VKLCHWFSATALAVLLVGAGPALAAEKAAPKEVNLFGTLRTAEPATAKADALAWLQKVNKTDDATTKAFEALWADPERSVLDKVTATFLLGDDNARKLLAEARNPDAPAPTAVPDAFKAKDDSKEGAFYRANLALAYARALANRRVYEEALDTLKTTKPESVVDPGTFLFFKAVTEHAMMKPREAEDSIVRLLDDVPDAPERYKLVAALMHFDMLTWRQKDLGDIARKMNNIERRLDLDRGGPETQRQQKEVVLQLDELIKKLENQKSGGS
jgi:hypothetical protein